MSVTGKDNKNIMVIDTGNQEILRGKKPAQKIRQVIIMTGQNYSGEN